MFINEESAIFLADNNVAYENDLRDDTVDPKSAVSTSIEDNDNNIKQDNVDANNDETTEGNNVAYENVLRDHTINPESVISTSIKDNDNNTKQDNVDENNDEIEDDAIDDLIKLTKPYKSTAKTKSLVKKLISQLPVKPYYEINFTEKEIVLVIGGETEGVNLESCKLLRARNCTRLNIPLTNGVDSLNVGVAVGIVTFEMKRQFVARKIDDE